MGVLHSFPIKYIFLDKVGVSLFYFCVTKYRYTVDEYKCVCSTLIKTEQIVFSQQLQIRCFCFNKYIVYCKAILICKSLTK